MKFKLSVRSFALRLVAVISLASLLFVFYLVAIRPSQLHWGATQEEVARSMPADELVPSPSFCATRAVTIHARPEAIWPWLAQMGYNRAGYYGYDLIENIGSTTGLRSAGTILPALQNPKTGDVLPISAAASMHFGAIQPGSYLVWRGATTPSDGTIVWALYPIDEAHTRLVSRVRLHYHWSAPGPLLLDLFTEFGDHVAVRRILLGIKGHVEGIPSQSLAAEAIEIAVWLLALAELATAIMLVLFSRRWVPAWCLGLAAGLVLFFVLYAHAPVWIGVTFVFILFAAMLMLLRRRSEYPAKSPA